MTTQGGEMEVYQTPFTPIQAHSMAIESMLVIPDKDALVTATKYEVKIWQLPSLRPIIQDGGYRAIQALGYYAPTQEVLVGSMDIGLTLLNPKSQQRRRVELPTRENKGALTIASDGAVAALYTDREEGRLWDWNSKQSVGLKKCQATNSFAFSHDGRFVAAIQGYDVQIWKTETGDEWFTIQEPADYICFLPGHSLVMTNAWGGVMLHQYDNLRNWHPKWSVNSPQDVRDLAAPPSSTSIACLTKEGITSYDVNAGQATGHLWNGRWVKGKLTGEVYEEVCTLTVSLHHNLAFAGDRYGILLAW
jgi:WD40 repeat protein